VFPAVPVARMAAIDETAGYAIPQGTVRRLKPAAVAEGAAEFAFTPQRERAEGALSFLDFDGRGLAFIRVGPTDKAVE
jgi:hypothetical protein